MSGHHLVISGEGALRVRCNEPSTAPCHAVFDCGCDDYSGASILGGDGPPYHITQSGEEEIHVGRFQPAYCGVEEWFSMFDPEVLLSGEYAIPLRVEWGNDGPTLHLPEQTKEAR